MASYYENMIKTVLEASLSKDWQNAVLEWEIYDFEEDEEQESSCVCGKEGLRYLYTIHNRYTHRELHPIGSCCIKKFGRKDFNDEIKDTEELFRLYHAVRDGKRIELSSEYFSKNLLAVLYHHGAFKPTAYNDYDGWNDYKFMLNMFNKRKSLSERQYRKTMAIINYTIKPWIKAFFMNR